MTTLAIEQTGPRGAVWTGRTLSGIGVAFMLFDASLHIAKPPFVVKAFAEMGFPASQSVTIGLLALIGVIVYLIPRTAVFGAVLLTGYLGGAIATQLSAGAVPFNVVFPMIIATLFWGGLVLRDSRVASWLVARRG